MKILVHDYAGYAFHVQLARHLARRGQDVLYLYSGSNTTPQGPLQKSPTDPPSFHSQAITLRRPIQKYALVQRWLQEREYAGLLARAIQNHRPELVISCNTPLDAQAAALTATRQTGAKFVFWLQDIIGVATNLILTKKLPGVGRLLGWYYIQLERRLLAQSDLIIPISNDFLPLLREWGTPPARTQVIPNWAPLENLPVLPKANPWSIRHGLDAKKLVLYTGTLGMKHDPNLILQLAISLQSDPSTCVMVASQGPGADWLRERKAALGLDNLLLTGYQPTEQLPEMLAAADILVSVLEKEAGVFSVPSKVLAYLCARRALLLAVPAANLAARIVSENQAGLVVTPGDIQAFVSAAQQLLADPALRETYAAGARRYAEATFDIEKITDQFEALFQGLARAKSD